MPCLPFAWSFDMCLQIPMIRLLASSSSQDLPETGLQRLQWWLQRMNYRMRRQRTISKTCWERQEEVTSERSTAIEYSSSVFLIFSPSSRLLVTMKPFGYFSTFLSWCNIYSSYTLFIAALPLRRTLRANCVQWVSISTLLFHSRRVFSHLIKDSLNEPGQDMK